MKNLTQRLKIIDNRIHNGWLKVVSIKQGMSFISNSLRRYPKYTEFMGYRNGVCNGVERRCGH